LFENKLILLFGFSLSLQQLYLLEDILKRFSRVPLSRETTRSK